MKRFGLQHRFVLGGAAALLLTLLLMVLSYGYQADAHREIARRGEASLQQQARLALQLRGEAIARLLADSLVNPTYYFDLQTLGEIARSALAQADVDYVQVFDADGLLLHDGSPDIAAFGEPLADALAPRVATLNALQVRWSEAAVDVSMPIQLGDQRIGGVRVGLSLERARQLESDARTALLREADTASRRALALLVGLFGLLVAMGLVLTVIVSRALVQPIRQLAEAARAIEAGDFRQDLSSSRRDEVGDLIRAFSRMSESVDRHDRDIRRIAYGDSLTGLPNRLAMRELLEHELQAQHGHGWRIALLFIDLDDFKRINDSLGHDAGDQALSQFAQRIQTSVEAAAGDGRWQVARFGGDEFVALVLGAEIRDIAAQAAEGILRALQAPVEVLGRQVHVGASIGITIAPEDGTSAAVLLKNGDIAMYQAKLGGKHCYRFYSRAMDLAAERRVQLEHDLRGAWERGELSLVYQPIARVRDGRLIGAEALLRWKHPLLGEVPPSAFIEIAETSGLIERLGETSLLQACRDARAWCSDDGLRGFVSVNLSARQLRSARLVEQVAAALAGSGLHPSSLHLELTETAVLDNQDEAFGLLQRLRDLGVRIWLDDFGTGFSGLSHLRQTPVDGVKIDRSFIADILRDPDDLALTTAVIAMAHSLSITVVAEGVENEGQFELLRARGCDLAQGFWLGLPMTAGSLARALGCPG